MDFYWKSDWYGYIIPVLNSTTIKTNSVDIVNKGQMKTRLLWSRVIIPFDSKQSTIQWGKETNLYNLDILESKKIKVGRDSFYFIRKASYF